MKVLVLVKATKESEAGQMPDENSVIGEGSGNASSRDVIRFRSGPAAPIGPRGGPTAL